LLAAAVLLCGCQKPVHFPAESQIDAASAAGAFGAYDTNGDGQADFFTYADSAGRIDRIGYCSEAGGGNEIIDLGAIDISRCRHLVIILDGIGYQVARDYYDSGGLRLFYPPSKVIAPYPTLTDLCMEDMLGYVPCEGFESEYFDRKVNRVVGGKDAYLAGANQPYNRLLHYRADLILDAVGYVLPRQVFGKEINDAKQRFDSAKTKEFIAYFVSSAGLGTAYGAEGQVRCLQAAERFANQVAWETRGLVAITIITDHGHSYTPSTRLELAEYLRGKGWKLTRSLHGPRDVAYIHFGLETYASFSTQSPAELAADLIACDGVEIASYADGESVVVLAPGGARAMVRQKSGRYSYQDAGGDPLKLHDALATLTPDAEGYYDSREMLAATIDSEYPAAAERVWRAHFALAENPPDVIISLADRYYSGSQGFSKWVDVASTHGGLNRSNSTAFIMSTAGPLPPFMQSVDVPANMSKLFGRPWPMGKDNH